MRSDLQIRAWRFLGYGVVAAAGAVAGGCLQPGATTCADGRICPADTVCHLATEQCVLEPQLTACADQADGATCSYPGLGAEGRCQRGVCEPLASQMQVVFVSPEDGATEVRLNVEIIVSLSFEPVADSLAARFHLIDEATDRDFPATLLPGVGNSQRFRPDAALAAHAGYIVRVDAGVEAVDPGVQASAAVFESRFQTSAAADLTAPEAVSGLVVIHDADRTTLRWTPATDADTAGVLILRDSAPVTVQPVPGTLYPTGAAIGTATVQGVTVESEWVDVHPVGEPYHYAVFAFDESSNYAVGRAPPSIESLDAIWCPDQSGTFEVIASGASAQQLWIGDTHDTPVADGVFFPEAGAVLGSEALPPLASGLLVEGQRHGVRPVATSDQGTAIGVAQELWVSPNLLAAIAQPYNPGVGGTTRFEFETYGWSAFEATVDTEPGPGFTWSGAVTFEAPGRIAATVDAIGSYAFRVRPVESRCSAEAPWTQSALFATGQYRYVRPGGAGDHSGVDPDNAMASIAGALASATGPVVVNIAAGDYNEDLSVGPGQQIRGSFNAAFTARSLDPPTTRVVPVVGDPTIGVAISDALTLIDGLVIEGTPLGCQYLFYCFALDIQGDATVQNSVIRAPPVTRGQGVSLDNGAAVFRRNEVECSSALTGTGISIYDQSASAVLYNRISGCDTGVTIEEDGVAVVHGNDIGVEKTGMLIVSSLPGIVASSNAIALSGPESLGFSLIQGTLPLIVNNTVTGPAVGKGVHSGESTPSIVNNLMVLSYGGRAIHELSSTDTSPVRVESNFFARGATLYQESTGSHNFDEICPGGNFGLNACATTLMTPIAVDNGWVPDESDLHLAGAGSSRLTAATPAQVRQQGVDMAAEACAYAGWSDCSVFGLDRDGVARTCPNPGTSCYSIGAYEYDAP